jgi:hypothetical protein
MIVPARGLEIDQKKADGLRGMVRRECHLGWTRRTARGFADDQPAPALVQVSGSGKMSGMRINCRNLGKVLLQPQVERLVTEHELYLKLFITTSGGW